jgi:hypothetical protein
MIFARIRLSKLFFNQITPMNKPVHVKKKNDLRATASFLRVWPVHPVFILMAVPFLPTCLYLNRGYTNWYILITLSFLLTQIEPLRRFLIVQGISVCAGWYAALVNDFMSHGRFAHILYMNGPSVLKAALLDESGNVVYTNESIVYMGVSHVLDIIFHPGIAYLLYKSHRRAGGTVDEIFSRKNIAAAFALSRFWSFVHIYHQFGKLGFWYYGYGIYSLRDLDCWMIAYVAEALSFLCMIAYKSFDRFDFKVQMHQTRNVKVVI